MNNVYGYCPRCGGLGMSRERRLNGNDRCENGHSYPSSTSVANPLLPVAPATGHTAETLADALNQIAFSAGCDAVVPPPPNEVVAAVRDQGMRLALQAEELFASRKRGDSLALAYREQQGENDALRVANTMLLAERDLYRAENTNIRAEAGGMEMEIDDLHSEIEDLRARTTSSTQERAVIVAWLRRKATDDFCALRVRVIVDDPIDEAADAIERGEHRREGDKP